MIFFNLHGDNPRRSNAQIQPPPRKEAQFCPHPATRRPVALPFQASDRGCNFRDYDLPLLARTPEAGEGSQGMDGALKIGLLLLPLVDLGAVPFGPGAHCPGVGTAA